jgi:hypothetical protein
MLAAHARRGQSRAEGRRSDHGGRRRFDRPASRRQRGFLEREVPRLQRRGKGRTISRRAVRSLPSPPPPPPPPLPPPLPPPSLPPPLRDRHEAAAHGQGRARHDTSSTRPRSVPKTRRADARGARGMASGSRFGGGARARVGLGSCTAGVVAAPVNVTAGDDRGLQELARSRRCTSRTTWAPSRRCSSASRRAAGRAASTRRIPWPCRSDRDRALPKPLRGRGDWQRYGFHGLSYE